MYDFIIDDLTGTDILTLLSDHQDRMAEHSPPESRHVLDVESLKQPDITFWSAWANGQLMGCVALKHWDKGLGEIKSMKTAPGFVRKGVGGQLLEHVIQAAIKRGYAQIKLETGSMQYFKPARRLYRNYGFVKCEPFAHYVTDINSVFMCLDLS